MNKPVSYWIGPTGTGKSHQVVETFLAETERQPVGGPLFWVVPNDTAFATEQMLMSSMPSALRPEVVTFERLADRIRLHGGRATGQTMNRTGKQILLGSAYRDARDELGPFRHIRPDGSFFDMVIDVFDEFAEHEVDLTALEGALESAAASLAHADEPVRRHSGTSLLGKLRDLCTLYIRYRTLLGERGFFDPALNLTDAADCVADVPWMSDAQFVIDGFSNLTPQQIHLMVAFAQHAEKLIVIGDHAGPHMGSADREGLLELTSSYFPRLSEFVGTTALTIPPCAVGSAYQFAQLSLALRRVGISVDVRSFETSERFECESLGAVERLLRTGERTYLPETRDDAIAFWVCKDEETEAHAVAHAITQWVEGGEASFSDIAVVCPASARGAGPVSEAFNLYQIPFTSDAFPKLSTHPLGRFLGLAIRLLRDDMDTESVAAFIRAEYVQLSATERDRLDMYIRTHGIHGADAWATDEIWTYEQNVRGVEGVVEPSPEDQFVDSRRRSLHSRLAPFLQLAKRATLAPLELAQAIWELLAAFDVKTQVAMSVVREDSSMNPLLASEEEQAWGQIVALLNDLATVYPHSEFERDDALALVLETLEREHLSTIPSGVDQVFVCDFEQAKAWTRPYVFVVGVDDTAWPIRTNSTGLLQDDEREVFSQLFGTPLGWTEQERFLLKQAVPYRTLTRASRRLTVSYAAFVNGAERRPALHLTFLRDALGVSSRRMEMSAKEALAVEAPASNEDLPVLRPTRALEILIQAFRSVTTPAEADALLQLPLIQDILDYFWRATADGGRASLPWLQGMRGLMHDLPQGTIPPDVAALLFGSPLKTSVNRLESYASCPYAYFIRYGLRVEPVNEHQVRPQDIGNLLHDVVYGIVQELEDADISTLNVDAVRALVRHRFEDAILHPSHQAVETDALRRVRSRDLQRYVEIVGEILWRQLERGEFRPHALEWSFGLDEEGLPPYRLVDGDGAEIELRGRIDRVDLYETEEARWYRIFDYKTRAGQHLDPTLIYYGLQLQLLTYAAVVGAMLPADKPALPAGVHYLPLVTQTGLQDGPEVADKAHEAVLKVYRAEGYMSANAVVIEAMDRDLAGRRSSLYKEVYKQDGSFLKAAKVWTDDEWSDMLAFVEMRVRSLASEIRRGKIAVRPYLRKRAERACHFCAYQSICQFEHSQHARHYRVLRSRRFDDLREAAREEAHHR